MEALINELFAGVITLLGLAIVALIKLWADVQSMKKDITKLETQQLKDDDKFDKIMEAIAAIKESIAAIAGKTN